MQKRLSKPTLAQAAIRSAPTSALTFVLIAGIAGPVASGNLEYLSGEALKALLMEGRTYSIAGADESYAGTLALQPDGTAVGTAKTRGGKSVDVSGTWVIKGNQFCRKWKFNAPKEICESWMQTGEREITVFIDDEKIGTNSW